MTRFARPGFKGKKTSEDATKWEDLQKATKKTGPFKRKTEPTVYSDDTTEVIKQKRKKKKIKEAKIQELMKVDTSAESTPSASNYINTKPRPPPSQSNDFPVFNKNRALPPGQKLGRGKFAFSKMDPELKRQQRADVHKNRRGKMNPCFVCRGTDHKAADCPEGRDKGVGMCFKCASTEHTSERCRRTDIEGFPHAKCFICNETGHLSRACPDNPRGLYPNGGCCKECGSVEHFAKDCTKKQKNVENTTIKLKTLSEVKGIDDDGFIPDKKKKVAPPPAKKIVKVVKF